ncbi:pyridine nucleotide-disulphide oxidoreductase dimerisation region [Catenulispora acidiphila DSM 44928]|uniref:Pyridine nucleotide-disulphide oxidoreductase dimerisation region n=1 Tax=Catenulispora acidiphila (strain DSM 44928 / JCM 14897 / NBRC 102108 / NRRL B-24433 / ID139908) TaxID=479433 RepID=C7PXM6_CATAD|nr:FAD-dependent oxidoreductase [Catenulispora acidiphila]ACU71479.1 pyridine nucleotide-disulphide oxidoreductase dimerisation region [Catenulispora acidiphila DSM 44928]
MDTMHADLLVIGFGKGGKTLAAKMGRLGRRVVMVEQSDQMYGGTCINIGCVPTKSLIHHAQTRPAGADPREWYAGSVAATASLTGAMRGKNFGMLDELDSVTVVTGTAAFLDEKTVEVTAGSDRLEITAETIVINTGAQNAVPDIPGLRASKHLVTATELIGSPDLPRRLVVLGGGYQGIEFAAMLSTYGTEVTVLEAGVRILPREDEDVVGVVEQILTDDGVTVRTGVRVTRVEDTADGALVHYEANGADGTAGTSGTLEADVVLSAVGRTPRTAELRLDAAGIRTTVRGAVEVDEHLRTNRPHIFAVGDVNGGPQFTYISLDDSRIVADQLLGEGKRATSDRVAVPYTLFMGPPLARVGVTETEALATGRPVRIVSKAVAAMAAMPRAGIVGETRGVMKFVIAADTDEVLGAAILSVDSQELINTVALAMRSGVTASTLRDAIYTHPSSTEAFNEVLATVVR